MNERLEARRRFVVIATTISLVLSLIGGSMVLLLRGESAPGPVALKPLEPAPPPPPAPSPAPEPEPSSGPTDLSMFGFGDSADVMATDTSSTDMYADSAAFTPGGGGGLPMLSLPPAPALPATAPIDWGAAVAPLIQALANAQAANVAGSITGSVVGSVTSVLSTAAVVVGDLLLFAAISNNGPNILGQLQDVLATAIPAATAAALAAGVPQLPAVPDLTGLTAAFAAAAAVPPIGVPALPQLPTPEQLAAGLAGLGALAALPALPAIAPPQLPQLPRPDEVVGGVVGGVIALGVVGLILGALAPKPPSITQMLGLPF